MSLYRFSIYVMFSLFFVYYVNYANAQQQPINFTGIDSNITKAVNLCGVITYMPLLGTQNAIMCQDKLYNFTQDYCVHYHDQLSVCRHNIVENFLKGTGYTPTIKPK